MSWAYRISMQMKLFIALFPLLLALVWFAGSGIVSRINTEPANQTKASSSGNNAINNFICIEIR
ncbi:hypothetical protein [Salmonella enterica]|uniref:hypothetical protein n=1 Tax=Salmonella enterica TaxID=28901 RepID=UPI001C5C3301|nr:hypothetical protein [Salmonella enterica]VXG77155.1 Methyl-accepting chemotaxis protein CDS [Salmonella enterica subsp. enterica serovar Derby]